MGTKGAPRWYKDFQSRLVLAEGRVFRRRALARSRTPVVDSPLTAPLSNSGGFPVKLGLVFGARLSVWGIGPLGPCRKGVGLQPVAVHLWRTAL